MQNNRRDLPIGCAYFALILLGIFSTIKLSLFIALIIIDLLILVAGVLAEYMSEKRFNKDYKNYKAEHTVVARKIEVEPRRKEVKVEEKEEVNKPSFNNKIIFNYRTNSINN